ncbi:MAG: hypothetical protein M1821_007351 [Bathelium mastoideum]|nr:MAG: hypothetical protein M1821_007351 [Bathelium mastoideum]
MADEKQELTSKPAANKTIEITAFEEKPELPVVPELNKNTVATQLTRENSQDEEQAVEQAHILNDVSPESPVSKSKAISLVLTLCGAAFLNTLSAQAVVIVLPTIGADLSIPLARQQWIVSSYSLTFGCFLLLWGRLADVYGKRLVFIWGSVWVTVVTIIIPFAPTEIAFDVFRGLQGLGAAANVPTAIGILGVTFKSGKSRNYAFAFYGAGAPLGAVIGNLLSGFVTEFLSWKWVFWILAIFAAMVTVAGWLLIPKPAALSPEATAKSAVDWVGGVLITIGLFALLFALTEGNIVGWATPWIPILIVLSLLITTAFILWQSYLERHHSPYSPSGSFLIGRPLIKPSIFTNTRFSAAMIVMALFFSSFNNYLIYTTYFFQSYLYLSTLQSTLRFIPTGVVGILMAMLTGHLLSRVPTTLILVFSTVSMAAASLLFVLNPGPAAGLSGVTTYWAFGFPAMCLSIAGADTIQPSLLLFTAQSLPQEDQALGGAMINAVREVGRAVGLAVATAVQTAVERAAREKGVAAGGGVYRGEELDQAFLEGLRAAGWFGVGMAAAAMVVVVVAFRGVGTTGGKRG